MKHAVSAINSITTCDNARAQRTTDREQAARLSNAEGGLLLVASEHPRNDARLAQLPYGRNHVLLQQILNSSRPDLKEKDGFVSSVTSRTGAPQVHSPLSFAPDAIRFRDLRRLVEPVPLGQTCFV